MVEGDFEAIGTAADGQEANTALSRAHSVPKCHTNPVGHDLKPPLGKISGFQGAASAT